MQITLNQEEIEVSIRNYVLGQLAIRDDQEISIELRAGRGENGFTATLDIRNRTGQSSQPKQGPRLVQQEPNVAAPKEDKTGISAQKAEEPKAEKATPAATGPTPKAAAKKAEAEAPKKAAPKGIFATKPKGDPEKTAEEKQAEEATTDAEAEEGVPDQETPAEEAAREEATASNPFAGDEDGDSDETQDGNQSGDEAPAEKTDPSTEKPKSIFAFAPKKSAG